MSITVTSGWWIIPTLVTIVLFVGWRLFGIRMGPSDGGMFPDAMGALAELAGYVVAALLSVIVWLVWALVG